MTRSQRLLNLIHLLRGHRFPVSGSLLANTLEVSLRTLYRDIATLQAQGADIQGEAGVGYVLKPGFMLPPLMFSEEELEALMLGARWVMKKADPSLGESAKSMLTKIGAVLPAALQQMLDGNTLLIGPGASPPAILIDMRIVRECIRSERKASIRYMDLNNSISSRIIWPFALGYFDGVRMLVAWCETRKAFRHFRADLIQDLAMLPECYPRHRQALLKEWRKVDGTISP